MINDLKPYVQLARLDKPTGAFLVLLPALWGLVLGHGGIPSLREILIFTLGAFLIRGAGCTANDYFDRHLDPLVERTKFRPLARGAVTPQQALVFLAIQLSGAASLLFFLPALLFYYALGAVALLLTYPLLKRITYWPQLFLGFCMNYGLVMAYVSITGRISLEVFILYGGTVLWTLGYDTIYGHQDRQDDPSAGVKSTALLKIGGRKGFIAACYAGFVASLGCVFWLTSATLLAYGVLFLSAGLLVHQVWQVRFDDPARCWQAFRANVWVGFVVLIGINSIFD